MARVSLVLGAGGVVGQAYHAGVLAALEHDYGWDPRTADIIVGTSAGAITASLLRSGVPASELAAWTVKAPLAPEGQLMEEMFGTEHPQLEPFRARRLLLRTPALPGWRAVQQMLTRPWQNRPRGTVLALIPPGPNDVEDHLRPLAEVEGGSWPARDLWICAARTWDGRRVVFGQPGAPEVSLHRAVAASCAMPGYFKPVVIEGNAFVDGGAHSPTNADLLRGHQTDLVIVVSPMSGPAPLPTDVYGVVRRRAGRLARREVAALRRSGNRTVVFRPGSHEQDLLRNDPMSRDALTEIVQASFLAAGRFAARKEVGKVLLTATARG